jgi:hypothetical protein
MSRFVKNRFGDVHASARLIRDPFQILTDMILRKSIKIMIQAAMDCAKVGL